MTNIVSLWKYNNVPFPCESYILQKVFQLNYQMRYHMFAGNLQLIYAHPEINPILYLHHCFWNSNTVIKVKHMFTTQWQNK